MMLGAIPGSNKAALLSENQCGSNFARGPGFWEQLRQLPGPLEMLIRLACRYQSEEDEGEEDDDGEEEEEEEEFEEGEGDAEDDAGANGVEGEHPTQQPPRRQF